MPRVGQVKASDDERLTDRIAIGVLTSMFPPALVDEVLETTGRVEQRHRLLPARVVVYFTLAMCLWADEGYEEVARLLVGGLKGMARWRGSWRVPTTGALTQARARLGPGALKVLFERVALPTSTKGSVGSWWRGLRLVAIDGTVLDLPDTVSNEAHFGKPSSGRGEMKGAFPQARVVALAECGTHAIIGARIGPCTTGETNCYRRATLLADQVQCGPGGDQVPGRRVLPVGTAAAPGQSRPADHGPGGRVHDLASLPGPRRSADPAHHHPAHTHAGTRDRACRTLWRAVGRRERVRRAEDPPAGRRPGAALEVTGDGHPRDLCPSARPLRHPSLDQRCRRTRRTRPRPGLVHSLDPNDPPPGHQPGGLFPLSRWLPPSSRRPSRCYRG